MLTIEKITESAVLPSVAHDGDAGLDLAAPTSGTVPAGATVKVPLGYKIALPCGTVGLVCPRSGLAAKRGVTVLNAPGIIDEGYRGELAVLLHNTGAFDYHYEAGDRIAQLVITPYVVPVFREGSVVGDTERGAGGFGSSGVGV